jgi:hypothetical protein
MITYKLLKDKLTNEVTSVLKVNGEIHTGIPFDNANKDYQEYLEWVKEGNTPEPADE